MIGWHIRKLRLRPLGQNGRTGGGDRKRADRKCPSFIHIELPPFGERPALTLRGRLPAVRKVRRFSPHQGRRRRAYHVSSLQRSQSTKESRLPYPNLNRLKRHPAPPGLISRSWPNPAKENGLGQRG